MVGPHKEILQIEISSLAAGGPYPPPSPLPPPLPPPPPLITSIVIHKNTICPIHTVDTYDKFEAEYP